MVLATIGWGVGALFSNCIENTSVDGQEAWRSVMQPVALSGYQSLRPYGKRMQIAHCCLRQDVGK